MGVRGDTGLVRDQHHRRTLLGRGPRQQFHDLLAGQAVERPRRLVGEDDRGLDDEGTRDRHALGLTAGHLTGPTALQPVETEPREPRRGQLFGRPATHPVEEERQGDVLDRRELGDELAELEHEPERRPAQSTALGVAHRVDPGALERHVPFVGHGDPGQAMEQRRFARTARAHDRDDLAGREGEVDAAQGLGLAEPLAQVGRLEQGAGRGAASCRGDIETAARGRGRGRVGDHGTSGSARIVRRSSSTRAAVRSSQRRSASRWKRA